MLPTETHSRLKETHKMRVKDGKIYFKLGNNKKVGVAILILDNILLLLLFCYLLLLFCY